MTNIFDWHEDKTPEEVATELGISDLAVVGNAGKKVIQTLETENQMNIKSNIHNLPFSNYNITDSQNDNKDNWTNNFEIEELTKWIIWKIWNKEIFIKWVINPYSSYMLIMSSERGEINMSKEKFLENVSIFKPDLERVRKMRQIETYGKYNILWIKDFDMKYIYEGVALRKKNTQEIFWVDEVKENVNNKFKTKKIIFLQEDNIWKIMNTHKYSEDEIIDNYELYLDRPNCSLVNLHLLLEDIINEKNWTDIFEFNKLEAGMRVKSSVLPTHKWTKENYIKFGEIVSIKNDIIQIKWENGSYVGYNKESIKELWLQILVEDLKPIDFQEVQRDRNKFNKRTKCTNIDQLRKGFRWYYRPNDIAVAIKYINLVENNIQTITIDGKKKSYSFDKFIKIFYLYKKDLHKIQKEKGYFGLTEEDFDEDNWVTTVSIYKFTESMIGSRIKINNIIGKIADITINDDGSVNTIVIKWANNRIETFSPYQLENMDIKSFIFDNHIPNLDINTKADYWQARYELYDIKRGFRCLSFDSLKVYWIQDIDEDRIMIWNNTKIREYSRRNFYNEFGIYKEDIDPTFYMHDDFDVPF